MDTTATIATATPMTHTVILTHMNPTVTHTIRIATPTLMTHIRMAHTATRTTIHTATPTLTSTTVTLMTIIATRILTTRRNNPCFFKDYSV